MKEYFKNVEVNQAINAWSAYCPKQGGHNDQDWFNLIVLFCKNKIDVSLDFFEDVNKDSNWDLNSDDISDLFKRYEDLRDFYNYLKNN